METYDGEYAYISSCTSYQEKIDKINAIIEALEATALKAAGKAHIDEYELDDGQTKIKTSYRSPSAIYEAINNFEKLKQRYLNKCIGRVFVARDAGSNNINTRNRGFN